MLLEVRNINTYRGPAHILRDVSIDVDSDEVVALVGRNGAGRTTIIESITGLSRFALARSASASKRSRPCRRIGARNVASAMRRRTQASSLSSRSPRT